MAYRYNPPTAAPEQPIKRMPNILRHLGIRARVVLMTALLAVLTLAIAAAVGLFAMDRVQTRLAESFAREHAALNREKLLAPIGRELALARKLADAELTRTFMRDEDDPDNRRIFFAEAESYRQLFTDQSYFVVPAASGYYYYNDNKLPFSDAARYGLQAGKADDRWFYTTLHGKKAYRVNIDVNQTLQRSMLWFNVQVRDGGQGLGVIGTGLSLQPFVEQYVHGSRPGVGGLLLDRAGVIRAHQDRANIAFGTAGPTSDAQRLAGHLAEPAARDALAAALASAAADGRVKTLVGRLDGREQVIAVAYLPLLDWFNVTTVDPQQVAAGDASLLWGAFAAVGVLLLLSLLLLTASLDHQLLRPLTRLTAAVRRMAAGDYTTRVPVHRSDEVGQLADACRQLSATIEAHTHELEDKVAERTQALGDAHRTLSETHRKVSDSIRYASLIQQGILPDAALGAALPARHLLLWRPRDVVSGDLYLFAPTRHGFLFGLVDCAGHGVSGALMTMLAHAAFKTALLEAPDDDPAALLCAMDAAVRGRFAADNAQVSTTMDAGLCHVCHESGSATFAGAHMDLYCADGDAVHVLGGDRRALGDKRPPAPVNQRLALSPSLALYMTSDGLLDQRGGEPLRAFGRARFEAALSSLARLPWPERGVALAATLDAYQTHNAQLDDIAVFGVAPCALETA
ncbi:HAMP domain-containing protein [Crenobacter intestini]|uniref:HAMP domain-containing protein n=2 Tax=Crenobacter intestini TaxID=2563443 RepID=A0A4T0V5J5_9NEIS|nr:HAMP domain-containing protein [Crenobacter intestini]